MTAQERLYTADDVWEIANQPENQGKQFELIEGELIVMSPSSAIPSVIAIRIARPLGDFVDDGDLGYVTGPDGGFQLSETDLLAPDVAYVSKTRQPELPERFFKIAPDLAVEVISPTDSIKAAQRKAMKYLSYGTRIVWLVYPAEKTVDVCLPAEDGMHVREVTLEGTLDGGDVLPGFTLPVKAIFPK